MEFEYYVAIVKDRILDHIIRFDFNGNQGKAALFIDIECVAFITFITVACLICKLKKNKHESNFKIEHDENVKRK